MLSSQYLYIDRVALLIIMVSTLKEKVRQIYEDKYKLILWFPIILVILALLQITIQTATTGDFVHRGITLKGGSSITLTSSPQFSVQDVDSVGLQTQLHTQFPLADISVQTLSSLGQTTAIIVESDIQDKDTIDQLVSGVLKIVPVQKDQYSVEVIGSALGESFFKETLYALLTAFVLMGIVVFISFRIFIPSMAVIASAFSDIVVTLAVFNLTGIKLSTAGVAAFLMLIGYSVDTDILLTTRVLKRKEGTVMERTYSAIKTGMTMIWAAVAAFLVALFFVQSDVIKQIMLILFIGLIVDMIMTWIQNVAMLRLYLERKERRGKVHGSN